MPLVALLLAVLALGSTWVMVNPMMQAPDEQVHLGYTQYLAETNSLPGKSTTRGPLSSEEFLAADRSNAGRAAQQLGIHVSWSVPQYRKWQRDSAALPPGSKRDGGGANNPAVSNPPLYYLTTVPAYDLGKGGDFFTRLTLVRMVSVLWLLLSVLGAWLLAGELFGRRRLLQTGVAGAVGLAPMDLFVSSSVSPDAALFATWSVVLWLAVRLLNHGLSSRRVLVLFLALGAACVVKATTYALLPGVLLVLVVAILRARRPTAPLPTEDGSVPVATVDSLEREGRLDRGWRDAAVAAGLAALGLVVTLGVWIVVSRLSGTAAVAQASDVTSGGISPGGLLTYLWQFYLPKLPGMDPVLGQAQLPVYDVLFKGVWAAFGFLETMFPAWVYVLLAVITVGVGGLAAAGLWRDRGRIDWAIGAFFLLAFLGLMAGLHLTEYQKGGFGFVQGRYLLPLAPLAGAALMRAIQWAPERRQAVLVGSSLGGLLVLNLFSLGLVLERFYA